MDKVQNLKSNETTNKNLLSRPENPRAIFFCSMTAFVLLNIRNFLPWILSGMLTHKNKNRLSSDINIYMNNFCLMHLNICLNFGPLGYRCFGY
jgi:hypothetical protein